MSVEEQKVEAKSVILWRHKYKLVGEREKKWARHNTVMHVLGNFIYICVHIHVCISQPKDTLAVFFCLVLVEKYVRKENEEKYLCSCLGLAAQKQNFVCIIFPLFLLSDKNNFFGYYSKCAA